MVNPWKELNSRLEQKALHDSLGSTRLERKERPEEFLR